MVNGIEKYKKELIEMYYLIGELDTLQATASYRENLPVYCTPSFDYLINEGISPTKNAVRISRMIGYPDEIIERIEDNIS